MENLKTKFDGEATMIKNMTKGIAAVLVGIGAAFASLTAQAVSITEVRPDPIPEGYGDPGYAGVTYPAASPDGKLYIDVIFDSVITTFNPSADFYLQLHLDSGYVKAKPEYKIAPEGITGERAIRFSYEIQPSDDADTVVVVSPLRFDPATIVEFADGTQYSGSVSALTIPSSTMLLAQYMIAIKPPAPPAPVVKWASIKEPASDYDNLGCGVGRQPHVTIAIPFGDQNASLTDMPIADVDTSYGEPYLLLNCASGTAIGAAGVATFAGFEDNALIFEYDFQPGDAANPLDLRSAAALKMNRAVIHFDNDEQTTLQYSSASAGPTVYFNADEGMDEVGSSLLPYHAVVKTLDLAFLQNEIPVTSVTLDERATSDPLQMTRCALYQAAPGNGTPATLINFTVEPDPMYNDGGSITLSQTSVSITGGNEMSAPFTIKGGAPGHVLLIATAAGNVGGSTPAVIKVEVLSAPAPSIRVATTQRRVSESEDGIYSVTLMLDPPPSPRATINLRMQDPDTGLTIPANQGVEFEAGGVNTSVSVDSTGQMTVNYVVSDAGTSGAARTSVRIAAVDANAASIYSPGFVDIELSNVSPKVDPVNIGAIPTTDAAGNLTGYAFPSSIAPGESVTVSFAIPVTADVAADFPTLQASVSALDGWESGWVALNDGSAIVTIPGTETASATGNFQVIVRVRDKDGGSTSITVMQRITKTSQVNITERKVGDDGVTIAAGYNGLTGLGRGDIVDSTGRARTEMVHEYIWNIKYNPNSPGATLIANPTPFVVPANAVLDDGSKGTDVEFDSFFHVWQADDGQCLTDGVEGLKPYPRSQSDLVTIKFDSANRDPETNEIMPQIFDISGVFSREHYPTDNHPDLDLDLLPDDWEMQIWGSEEPYAYETAAGYYGREGNGDVEGAGQDFLPNGANAALDYPLDVSNFDNSYAPYGSAFTHVMELRGVNHGLNAADSDPSVDGIIDEPRYGMVDYVDDGSGAGLAFQNGAGANNYLQFNYDDTRTFFGTDITMSDTDEDKLLDGWEYYFWYNAVVKGITGSRFDVTMVNQGTEITAIEIAQAFSPLTPGSNGQLAKEYEDDLDGDGLSNYEEMLLGTNPIHWDTDGDGMSDSWEVAWGLSPLSAEGDNGAGGNPDLDWMAFDGVNKHSLVFEANGFDPRTAWSVTPYSDTAPPTYLERDLGLGISGVCVSPNTTGYTNGEEYSLAVWAIQQGVVDEVSPLGLGPDKRLYMTNPYSSSGYVTPSTNETEEVAMIIDGYDSDGDGMPDGWELYCSDVHNGFPVLWPTNERDGVLDSDGDGLPNALEFQGTQTCAYDDPDPETGFTSNGGTIANGNRRWWNKHWATCPLTADTDGDTIFDGDEGAAFIYDPVANFYGPTAPDAEYNGDDWVPARYIRGCRRGGGLNPCSADTDGDHLPDGWELQYSFERIQFGFKLGMDGTTPDAKSDPTGDGESSVCYDYDGDGLENYQEYLAGAVMCWDPWRWEAGHGVNSAEYSFGATLNVVPELWDWALSANYWQDGDGAPYDVIFVYMPPHPLVGVYTTLDPSLADTDNDTMDDYYEVYHGLNPLLGWTDVMQGADGPMDFRVAPWNAGLPYADPDQDGIYNLDEALAVNQPEPCGKHTDPSPYWFTDISSPFSFVNLYYNWTGIPSYWGTYMIDESAAGDAHSFYFASVLGLVDMPSYLYSFEMNEGYDTDNDNLMDNDEVLGTTLQGISDPLDSDSPRNRKAIFLDGASAARTFTGFAHGKNMLRSWTVELWVRPLEAATGARQILIERPVAFRTPNGETDPEPSASSVRRNFRIGLDENGVPFAEYDSAGNSVLTQIAKAEGKRIPDGEWTHIAAVYDPVEARLKLYLNGVLARNTVSSSIPFTGIYDYSTGYPAIYDNDLDANNLRVSDLLAYTLAPIVIGASDSNPKGAVSGVMALSQPVLGDYFTGWIDEVRVWQGVRTDDEIRENYQKRFSAYDPTDEAGTDPSKTTVVHSLRVAALNKLSEYVASRETTQGVGLALNLVDESRSRDVELEPHITFDTAWNSLVSSLVATGGETPTQRIPALLLYHYTFDNLPDPRVDGVLPRSFDMINGRPLDYTGVRWWGTAEAKSTIYDAAHGNPSLYVPWIENTVNSIPLGHVYREDESDLASTIIFKADSCADSKYWQTYRTGNVEIDTARTPIHNNFKNTANPYGFSYIHGDGSSTEFHPMAQSASFYDSVDSTLYNNLLPLGGAYADLSVPLWDNGTNGAELFDTDGDGIPDYWEYLHGLDYNDPSDAFLDPDGDGLCNIHEFWAGTDPYSADSDNNGISDYEDVNPSLSRRMLGLLFTDNDYVEDQWEKNFDVAYASPYRYDEHLDEDGDGWSNWSERRFGGNGTTPENGAPSTNAPVVFPIPDLEVSLDYNGIRHLTSERMRLAISGYDNPGLQGLPKVVYKVPFAADSETAWPRSLTLTASDAVYGHLVEGKMYFCAIIDLDPDDGVLDNLSPNQNWSLGEPAALNDGFLQGVQIGWDKNSVSFTLTDKAASFVRYDVSALVGDTWLEGDVRSFQILAGGQFLVHEFEIAGPRTWICEADIIAGKTQDFGLDWNVPAAGFEADYELYYNGVATGLTWTNTYAKTLSAPVTIYPDNDVLYSAMLDFRFTLDPEITDVKLEIRRDSPTGAILYEGRFLAPARRTINGVQNVCVLKFPYALCDTLPNGRKFNASTVNDPIYWRVTGYSPNKKYATSGTTSAWATFFQNIRSGSMNGKGLIKVNVRYPGGAAFYNGCEPRIRVQAFDSASFNGRPAAATTITGEGAVTLYGLDPAKQYYLCAFIDQDRDFERDVWESYGYYRAETSVTTPYAPIPATIKSDLNAVPYVITIRDADTDNDCLPDALEYVLNGAGGGDWLSVSGYADSLSIAPSMLFSAPGVLFSNRSTDYDNDGIDDVTELHLGLRIDVADTDGDGLYDGFEIMHGMDPTKPDSLILSAVSFKENGKVGVEWKWDGSVYEGESTPLPLLMNAASPQTANDGVTYLLQATRDLANPDWQTIATINSETGILRGGNASVEIDSTGGSMFFRVVIP